MDFYYDEEDGKIKYTMDLSNLFAKETEELNLQLSLIDENIEQTEFDEFCDEVEEIIIKCYKNNSTDIEDLGDILHLIDKKITQLFTSRDNAIKFSKLGVLRKKVKKLANKKFREGHDWIFREQIEKKIIEPKIKYPDETPRDFLLVEEYNYQYNALVEYYWIPGLEKLKMLLKKYELD